MPPAADVDLLIPDTSALLDIIRGLSNASAGSSPRAPEMASVVLNAVREDRVRIGLIDLVGAEYRRNLDTVIASTESDFRETANRLRRLERALPAAAGFAIDANLAQRGRTIAESLMNEAVMITATLTDVVGADDRYTSRRPPSHGNQSSTHDGRIVESALRRARPRVAGSTWLLARNPKDYEQQGQLHPDLRKEFDAAGLMFARGWQEYADRTGLVRT